MLNWPSEKTVSCCLWSAQAERLSDLANPAPHLHCVVSFFLFFLWLVQERLC